MKNKYKYIIIFLIYKNLQIKYKHTALGFLWSLLHPFLYLLIFLLIFSNAFPAIHNYPLYVLSGLVFWIYFVGGTTQLCLGFIRNTHLIKSLGIPKSIYPLTDLGSELISFLLALIPFMILMFFIGLHINLNLLYLFPIILVFSIFIFSVGIILGSLNVFFRDVGILWITLNPALFYITPIAYSYNIIQGRFRDIISYNPMYHFLEIIRDVLYAGRPPSAYYFGNCLIITAIVSVLAIIIYRLTRNSFISNL